MEVVSGDPESRERDHARKRLDYALAGISEYWIIDPAQKQITVLSLHRGDYIVHARAGSGQQAASSLLPGFSVAADQVFAAAEDR